MSDTTECIQPDAKIGKHMRLTPAAYERAVAKFGTDSTEDLWEKLGLANRMMLWRLRRGRLALTHERALDIADRIGWPHSKVFEGGRRG